MQALDVVLIASENLERPSFVPCEVEKVIILNRYFYLICVRIKKVNQKF